MTSAFDHYRAADGDLPDQSWAWNLWGAGEENLGKDGGPELVPVPEPDADHMLVRIDSVGLCFSDVKIMRQGGSHPKLYNRDLATDPTRLGHEVSLTVIEVGENLQNRYHAGQRLAVQPDIYQDGTSTAYGYTIPGGLIQYHLMGTEMLDTDDGACLLPIPDSMGYAEASTLEPWGCVMAAYTQRRRLEPKDGGTMWILGRPGDEREYDFSAGLDAPGTIVLTDAPVSVRALVERTSATVVVRDGLGDEDYPALVDELTGGAGFDDIVMLDPRSAATAGAVAPHIARRGTLNLVGETALDGLVDLDVGRLHYDYTAYIGGRGPDIATSYGEARNRCDLRGGGTTVFVGAGGPMGLMHVQRAIQQPDGPAHDRRHGGERRAAEEPRGPSGPPGGEQRLRADHLQLPDLGGVARGLRQGDHRRAGSRRRGGQRPDRRRDGRGRHVDAVRRHARLLRRRPQRHARTDEPERGLPGQRAVHRHLGADHPRPAAGGRPGHRGRALPGVHRGRRRRDAGGHATAFRPSSRAATPGRS